MSNTNGYRRVKRVDQPGCLIPQCVLTLDLFRQHKDRIKVKRAIDTIGDHNLQKCTPYLDDGIQPLNRAVEFELSELNSDFGISKPDKKEGEEDNKAADSNANKGGDKYSIAFAEQKNGPDLQEFVTLFDDVAIRQGVEHSPTWFGKQCSYEIVQEKFNSLFKAPKAVASAEKYGKSFKIVVDKNWLKPKDLFIDGVQADSFESLLGLRNATYTVRFKFEKIWFDGDRKVFNARFVVTRINAYLSADESDEGFSTIQVQLKNDNGNSNSNSNSNSVTGDKSQGNASTDTTMADAKKGTKRTAEEAFTPSNPNENSTNGSNHSANNAGEFVDVPFLEKDPEFSSSPKRVALQEDHKGIC